MPPTLWATSVATSKSKWFWMSRGILGKKKKEIEGKKVDEKKKSERRGRIGGCKWRDVSRGGRLRVEDRRLNWNRTGGRRKGGGKRAHRRMQSNWLQKGERGSCLFDLVWWTSHFSNFFCNPWLIDELRCSLASACCGSSGSGWRWETCPTPHHQTGQRPKSMKCGWNALFER